MRRADREKPAATVAWRLSCQSVRSPRPQVRFRSDSRCLSRCRWASLQALGCHRGSRSCPRHCPRRRGPRRFCGSRLPAPAHSPPPAATQAIKGRRHYLPEQKAPRQAASPKVQGRCMPRLRVPRHALWDCDARPMRGSRLERRPRGHHRRRNPAKRATGQPTRHSL